MKNVLDYLCSGKGAIPYQIIKTLDSLEMKPENGDFFAHKDFYSTLSENNISADYENVKFFETIET